VRRRRKSRKSRTRRRKLVYLDMSHGEEERVDGWGGMMT
jgi:hypothetical protein